MLLLHQQTTNKNKNKNYIQNTTETICDTFKTKKKQIRTTNKLGENLHSKKSSLHLTIVVVVDKK
jgi:hypothetical protein